VGEIAEALRKANESVDGSDTEAAPSAKTAPKQSTAYEEQTSGEITAALSRANAVSAGLIEDEHTAADEKTNAGHGINTGNDATESGINDNRAEARRPDRSRSGRDSAPVIPENLGRVIFHVERHRHLGLRLRNELDRTASRSLAIVSPMRNEGKSTVSCNIAAAMASLTTERSVALVDLDLRNPSLAGMLRVQVPVGIEQVLQGRAKLEETCITLREPEIDLYPCAQPHRAAHELLVLPAFERFIRELEARYSAVIIDTPPTLLVPDSTLIMRSVGYCLAVASAGQTRVHRFTEMLDRLPREKILGKVLNNVPTPGHAKDDYYYNSNEGKV
jgi:Mrp family chromosome partitioning ATPase